MGDLRKAHLSTNLILFVILKVILVVGSHSFAGTIQLPQTGQTTCYDTAGTVIPCAGTGQDGDIRAGVPWPPPRFTITYCDTTGPCANQGSDCDGNVSTDMVKDNLTGLIWAKNANLPDLNPLLWWLGGAREWQEALDFANGLSLCGYSDWGLPNVNELESLVHLDQTINATWLNTQGFTNVQPQYYWSSSFSAYWGKVYTSSDALIVNMWMGNLGYTHKNTSCFVWPVRSGQ